MGSIQDTYAFILRMLMELLKKDSVPELVVDVDMEIDSPTASRTRAAIAEDARIDVALEAIGYGIAKRGFAQ